MLTRRPFAKRLGLRSPLPLFVRQFQRLTKHLARCPSPHAPSKRQRTGAVQDLADLPRSANVPRFRTPPLPGRQAAQTGGCQSNQFLILHFKFLIIFRLLHSVLKMKPASCVIWALVWTAAALADERPVTFNQDIAPLIFEHCAKCHRPGESGPFPLLNYADARKRAKLLAEVTARHYMPPWLPEGPPNEFLGDRRLSDAQVQLFQRWLEAGSPEGAAADLPHPPQWSSGWQLGEPDLIVRMPRPYALSAEGRDVYRDFVIPTPLTTARHVKAVEFRPDNPRVVHHAFVEVDYAGNARKLEGADGQPGFAGMNLPEGVRMPSGYCLSWQPGKTPFLEPPGFGWTLQPGQDLVLQTHLRPTGKPEELKALIGLYFTDIPPTNLTFLINLTSFNIDIPAGTNAYAIEDSLLLPVTADALAVLPHAHYLGKQLEGFARLPDGSSRRLLRIPDWDFNWQGDYHYAQPVHLPAGTLLQMHYLYDNSAANPHNPSQPPKRVRYGSQSSDEMGELWLQVQVKDPNDAARLTEAYADKQMRRSASHAEFLLADDPHDAKARTRLGVSQLALRQISDAIKSFRTAAGDDPAFDETALLSRLHLSR